jgi:hypothetical protein
MPGVNVILLTGLIKEKRPSMPTILLSSIKVEFKNNLRRPFVSAMSKPTKQQILGKQIIKMLQR